MSHVTPEDVRHVARLARIALSDAEVAGLQPQLERILAYVEQLRAVNTDGVEPTSHVLPLSNVLRKDEPSPSLGQDAVLALAPAKQPPFVKVPKVIET